MYVRIIFLYSFSLFFHFLSCFPYFPVIFFSSLIRLFVSSFFPLRYFFLLASPLLLRSPFVSLLFLFNSSLPLYRYALFSWFLSFSFSRVSFVPFVHLLLCLCSIVSLRFPSRITSSLPFHFHSSICLRPSFVFNVFFLLIHLFFLSLSFTLFCFFRSLPSLLARSSFVYRFFNPFFNSSFPPSSLLLPFLFPSFFRLVFLSFHFLSLFLNFPLFPVVYIHLSLYCVFLIRSSLLPS